MIIDSKGRAWSPLNLWLGSTDFGVEDVGLRPRYRVQGSGFRVRGSGFGVQGSGFGVQGSGFRVRGSGFGVWGVCGLKIYKLRLRLPLSLRPP